MTSLRHHVHPKVLPPFRLAKSARTMSQTEHVRQPGFGHCWSVRLEQPSVSCRNPNATEAVLAPPKTFLFARFWRTESISGVH